MKKLLVRQDYDVMEFVAVNFWTTDKVFSNEDGFYFAAALSEYDNDPNLQEDPRYATLELNYLEWGVHNNGTIFSITKDAPLMYCSDRIEDSQEDFFSKLFQATESAGGFLEAYRHKWRCPDPQDLSMWGDWSSSKG
jgi:hypothetical protein